MNKRNIIIGIIVAIILLVIMSIFVMGKSGKNKPVSEEKIINDINSNNEILSDYSVESISIIKRNTLETTDDIFIKLKAYNKKVSLEQEYHLKYNLYTQGGWILDEWDNRNEASYAPLKPVSDDAIKGDATSMLGFSDFKIVNHKTDLNKKTDQVVIDYNHSTRFRTQSGQVVLYYVFDSGEWIYNNAMYNECSDKWDFSGTWVCYKGYCNSLAVCEIPEQEFVPEQNFKCTMYVLTLNNDGSETFNSYEADAFFDTSDNCLEYYGGGEDWHWEYMFYDDYAVMWNDPAFLTKNDTIYYWKKIDDYKNIESFVAECKNSGFSNLEKYK